MKKIIVDKDVCIRCGACVGICPSVFTFASDDSVESIDNENILDNMSDELRDDALDALEGCPVSAIKEIQE